jgi:hypothetical protein
VIGRAHVSGYRPRAANIDTCAHLADIVPTTSSSRKRETRKDTMSGAEKFQLTKFAKSAG